MSPRFVRRSVVFCAMALLAACGSSTPTGTVVFSVEGEFAPEDLAEVSIVWDEEVTWTRQVTCAASGGLESAGYELTAYDRSIGEGLEMGLTIQAYDGPGEYERDEFQPTPALWIEFLQGDFERRDDEEDDERPDDDRGADDDDSAADDDDSAPEDPEGDDDDDPDDPDDDDEDDEERPDDDDEFELHWRFGSDAGGLCLFVVNDDGLSGSFSCEDIPVALDFEVLREDVVTVSGQWECSALSGGGAEVPESRLGEYGDLF